jgi:hypothetical protein
VILSASGPIHGVVALQADSPLSMPSKVPELLDGNTVFSRWNLRNPTKEYRTPILHAFKGTGDLIWRYNMLPEHICFTLPQRAASTMAIPSEVLAILCSNAIFSRIEPVVSYP